MNAIKPLLLTSVLISSPIALMAQGETVTVPATNEIVSTDGNWHRSDATAVHGGVDVGDGTRVLLPRDVSPGDTDPLSLTAAVLLAGSGLRGTITFPGQVPTPGESAIVSIIFPDEGANVRDLLVSIESPAGTTENRVTLTADMANTWVPIGGFTSDSEGDLTVRIIADEQTVSPDPFAAPHLGVSGLRIHPGSFDEISPLAAPPTPEADTPFEVPDLEEVDDPFAVSEEVDDPFAVPPADEVDDPFAAPPAEEVDDPFAVPPADEVDDPFAAPETVDDPFAVADEVDDPFAVTEEEVEDPFAVVEETEDPFAVPAEPEDPFRREDVPVVQPTPTPSPTPVATPRVTPQPTPEPVVLIDVDYHPTLDDAKAAARQSGKRVLVLFTGEGRRASEFDEAFRHPDMESILGDFEIVAIDYRTNRALARRYSVRQFPYIVILSSRGFTEDHIIGHGDRNVLSERLLPHTLGIFR